MRDVDVEATAGLEVVNERRSHVQTLTATGVGIDLELQGVLGRITGRRLVVEDGERGGDAALVIEDHICPSADGDSIEMELERSLGLPDAVQVRFMGGRVLGDEAARRVLELAVDRLVGRRQEEARVEDPIDLFRGRDLT